MKLHHKRLLVPKSGITISQANYSFILNVVKIIFIAMCAKILYGKQAFQHLAICESGLKDKEQRWKEGSVEKGKERRGKEYSIERSIVL